MSSWRNDLYTHKIEMTQYSLASTLLWVLRRGKSRSAAAARDSMEVKPDWTWVSGTEEEMLRKREKEDVRPGVFVGRHWGQRLGAGGGLNYGQHWKAGRNVIKKNRHSAGLQGLGTGLVSCWTGTGMLGDRRAGGGDAHDSKYVLESCCWERWWERRHDCEKHWKGKNESGKSLGVGNVCIL